jgi:hypothetical protein
MWKPPVKHWHKVPIDTYKFIYDEAKVRLEEQLSESESITNKSIKMLTAAGALFGFFIGFLLKDTINWYYLTGYGLFYLIELFLLYKLIAPKDVRWRGLSPEKSFQENLDSSEDAGYQTQITYYTAIGIIQSNISFMAAKNKGRLDDYKNAMILLLALIIATVAFVVWVIAHRP